MKNRTWLSSMLKKFVSCEAESKTGGRRLSVEYLLRGTFLMQYSPKFFLYLHIFLVIFLGGIILNSCGEQPDPLYEAFQNPPAEARPFVRWWWNGNRITESEIIRELDVLDDAGIGGIEINPIAMPDEAPEIGIEPLTWLSPEWNRMVKIATDEARKRGMISDMIVGTGWPFGGEFLPPEEQIRGVVLQKISLEGMAAYRAVLNDIIEYKRNPADEEVPEPELLFARLIPQNLGALSQVIDVTDSVNAAGVLEFPIPEGRYMLYLGTVQTGLGFREVTLGAPGAAGPCLDHYNAAAVERYINRVAEKLGPELGGQLGDALRALFVDSIELSGSNWTNDMLTEFRQRNGYNLEPYFPFVMYANPYEGYQDEFSVSSAFADTLRRVRYDYSKTLTELFLERFTVTYHNWCNEQNTVSRYQAYGVPWLMDMSEGYLIPDIPESNNWLFSSDPYSHGYNIWTKYTSSGAHLNDRRIASTEAMTNTRGVFQTTLEMIKRADDMNFIMGMNHSVLHGFNFSPPEAGFPGWVRFGAYFSEQNTWWKYLPQWIDYNARLSAVFQEAQPEMNVAILTPRADVWSTKGLARVPIHLTPWYGHRLWEPLNQHGYGVDYIPERIIRDGEKTGSVLAYGPMAYNLIILTDVQSMLPETAAALQEFVKSGGHLIIIGNRPSRSLSLKNAAQNDAKVQDIMTNLLNEFSAQVITLDAPVQDDMSLFRWTSEYLVPRTAVAPQLSIQEPDSMLYQVHYQHNERDIYFIVNHDPSREVSADIKFQNDGATPWKWNPEDGSKSRYPFDVDNKSLNFTLKPLESLLLVFEADEIPAEHMPEYKQSFADTLSISGPWETEFQHAFEDTFQIALSNLIDFGRSGDPPLSSFAGTIRYATTFQAGSNAPALLDLGTVHGISQVVLNGKSLGNRWWGQHQYETSDVLQSGENEIEIMVTTVLLNYVKSLETNAVAQRWTRNQDHVSVGMPGPVNLIQFKE
ncbi:MAG: hypothetical protein GF372_14625 [Candidatus Marinimicrobia bacterium]|nr:hypothetical protein [Candidatus Neomarinimicrobiota bacterium]